MKKYLALYIFTYPYKYPTVPLGQAYLTHLFQDKMSKGNQ